MEYKHIFGPVPSRRLGISLGVDLVPPKTCTLDCVYCESGKTTRKTIRRIEYVPTKEILAEIDRFLSWKPLLDYITFSGAGEPTLHKDIGLIINHIKKNFPAYKLALLTNGTLFYRKQVRKEVLGCDLIIPSLDAASKAAFMGANRHHSTLTPDKVISGIRNLRREYSGALWLEVFIVPGVNDTEKELRRIKKALELIQPDRIQLNTLDRPGTRRWVKPASKTKMKEIARFLGKAEIVCGFSQKKKVKKSHIEVASSILQTIARRPCTLEDLCISLGLQIREVRTSLEELLIDEKVRKEARERGIFYKKR